jgi:LysM repeat protein
MKRIVFLGIFAVFGLFSAVAQKMTWSRQYEEYFEKYKDVAIEQMVIHDIPASITLAQGVLESGAGKSELARKGNNHFGIKCNGWTGRKTYHDDDERNECFRAYNNVYESYEDHSRFLVSSQRYGRLFKLKRSDYKGWAKGLKACGYATSPTYATKLIDIIELYHLHRYDKVSKYDRKQVSWMRQGFGRPVNEFNKNYYVIARRGDTFRSIAADVDVPYKKLARYNERDKDDVLAEGEYVWLKKKRSKAPKDYKGKPHVVAAGESLYDIAQHYGIRLKSMYKMNQLPPDYAVQVGDRLRIR